MIELVPELTVEAIDAAALFVAAACPFLYAVWRGNPMHLPNLRKPNEQR